VAESEQGLLFNMVMLDLLAVTLEFVYSLLVLLHHFIKLSLLRMYSSLVLVKTLILSLVFE
jgi:hypothetical protein